MSQAIARYDTTDSFLVFEVVRGGTGLTVEATPEYDAQRGRHLLGITAATSTERVSYGPGPAVAKALATSWDYAMKIFDVIGKLASRRVSPTQLAGPVGIVQMSGQIATIGLVAILNFMAFIGVNLAVLNLLPLIITDGGVLFFLLLEAIRGRPISLKHQLIINRIAIALFVALFLFVTFNDVRRIPQMFRLFGR
jgi:regulator of sigma E protease